MSDKIFAVAVDGPSGAGKSTLAKAVAAELGIVDVDTGAIYRSIGCYMHDHQIDPHDAQAVAAALPQVRIQIRYGADGLQRMILNDEDVTDRIRLPEMSKFASAVSAIPAVRAFLLDMQRDMAKQHSVIMDGRDIGTVVLPDADVKIYLTAGADVRAQRRMKELAERLEVKNAKVMWPVRIAVSGRAVTPGGAVEICRILGRDETLRRIDAGIAKLEG